MKAPITAPFKLDANNVVLVTTRNRVDGHSEIWWKQGRIAELYPKTNWTIAAKSSEETNNGRLASTTIDGDINTAWIARYSTNPTNYPDHFITVDLSAQLGCIGVSFVQKFTDRKIKVVEVWSSVDNVTYEHRGTFTLREPGGIEQFSPFPGLRTFRYLKVVPVSGYDTAAQPGLAEVGVYKLR